MGMLVDGVWQDQADQFMQNGKFRREPSRMPTVIDADTLTRLAHDPAQFVLVVSDSCPWSHAALLAATLKGFGGRIVLQMAGGKRQQGYGLRLQGPLARQRQIQHLHQLYTATDPGFTGRATVPVLWDTAGEKILSNSSQDLMLAFERAGAGPELFPADLEEAQNTLTSEIFAGLSNAVYRAGLAEQQAEYDRAVDLVFTTMMMLETRLTGQKYLFGEALLGVDIRLFACLVRFDTVYATHFRCTRKRLVDHPALWRFTRRVFQHPGVRETVNFDEIRAGYYLNDGNHNPSGIIAAQPQINWQDVSDL